MRFHLRNITWCLVIALSFLFSACNGIENEQDVNNLEELNSALIESTGHDIEEIPNNIPLSDHMAEEVNFVSNADSETGSGGTENADTDDGRLYSYDDDIVIIGEDGVRLPANVFIPADPAASHTYPAVILAHSWGSDEHQYGSQAKIFAEKGYIVLRYTSRGWGEADGKVDVFGKNDMADLKHVIDWLENHTPVDSSNIGMLGVSYGSIMSLMGLSRDNRVKTAACLSGNTDLMESMWGGKTPHMVWASLLIASGSVKGRLDPVLVRNFADILIYNICRINEIIEWAALRSPITYINNINIANKPVYISSNWHDNMFQTGQHLSYFEKLTSPRKIDIRNGVHGTTTNEVWDNVFRWMDYWLKGDNNGILDEERVSMTVKNTGEIVRYRDWPAAEVARRRFYLSARKQSSTHGGLQSGEYRPLFPETNIYNSSPTVATTGVPVLSEYLDSVDTIGVYTWLPSLSTQHGIYYQTGILAKKLKLRGGMSLKLQTASSLPCAAYFVYLYDVDSYGKARLITHGTFSTHEAVPFICRTRTINLVPAAWDIPPGHRLAVAIDTLDPLYAPPTLLPYSVQVFYSMIHHSVLTIDIQN